MSHRARLLLSFLTPLALAGAQESPLVSQAVRTKDGRLSVSVISTAEHYYILHHRVDLRPGAEEKPVAMKLGEAGVTTLIDPLGAVLQRGFYRVSEHRRSAPLDTDGDGRDDVTELLHPIQHSPLNPAKEIPFRDGATSLTDRESYKTFSYQGTQVAIDNQLRNLEFIKFQIEKANTARPELWFINTITHRSHPSFMGAIGLGGGGRPGGGNTGGTMRGVMTFWPLLRAPNGEPGLYTIEFEPNDAYSFERIKLAQEIIAANAGFIRNNLGYHPIGPAINVTNREMALYRESRIPVYFDADLVPRNIGYLPLHIAQGFGRLRLIEGDDRPSARDIVLYRSLPNELSRVAGMITEVPQTPLSHVNLRAIQDDVPNAFITGASTSDAIAPLIGKNVFYKVEADGYVIREATAQEVDAHFDSIRPKQTQIPARDMTLTKIRPLSEVAFTDSDAFGVKAANVATLRVIGLPPGTAPDGFGVPFYFYDEFMKHNGLYEEAKAMLSLPTFHESTDAQIKALSEFRKRIKDGTMPEWMTTALTELQASFPAGTGIRCRSSTNNEDLPGFSGAGLYDSFTHNPDEGHLSKTIQRVYASLWNFRAYEEREFYRVDHFATAMGVLTHPNFSNEKANGVAVSKDPIYQSQDPQYYVNVQLGDDLVTNPDALSVPEEVLMPRSGGTPTLVRSSNLIPEGQRLLDSSQLSRLRESLRIIHDGFRALYRSSDPNFAMEIEFKITSEGKLAIKQARPWVN